MTESTYPTGGLTNRRAWPENRGMSDDDPDRIDPNDEYPLGPPGKSLAEHWAERSETVLPLYHEPVLEEKPKEEPFRFQFTLAQLLWVMTLVAVGLSLLRCFPVGYSQMIAAVAGLTLMVSLLILELVKPTDRRIYLAWGLGAALYVLSCIMAIFRG